MAEKMATDLVPALGVDMSQMLAQNPGADRGPLRHGEGDAEARRSAGHAGDAHGHHDQRSAAAGRLRGSAAARQLPRDAQRRRCRQAECRVHVDQPFRPGRFRQEEAKRSAARRPECQSEWKYTSARPAPS